MAGPAEEVGKAASTFMESIKSQPLALALVVMNLGLLGLIYYVANTAAARGRFDLSADRKGRADTITL